MTKASRQSLKKRHQYPICKRCRVVNELLSNYVTLKKYLTKLNSSNIFN